MNKFNKICVLNRDLSLIEHHLPQCSQKSCVILLINLEKYLLMVKHKRLRHLLADTRTKIVQSQVGGGDLDPVREHLINLKKHLAHMIENHDITINLFNDLVKTANILK